MSRGLGDVYKRQTITETTFAVEKSVKAPVIEPIAAVKAEASILSILSLYIFYEKLAIK